MSWTAPQVDRVPAPLVADERQMLEGSLEFQRQTLLWKCSGLTVEQLRRREVGPSIISLLGLVRHMAEVERVWFRARLAGLDVGYLYCSDDDLDAEFNGVDSADAQADFAVYARELDAAREIAAAHGLDDTFAKTGEGVRSVRWLYVHLIEEYARHNGHADLLRERIDGATGV